MPAPVLHVGAVVTCMHGGTAQPTTPFPRVTVSGQPVVTQATIYAVAGCGLTGSGAPPCVTAQWVMGATRVTAGGMPVILQTSQAVCTPTGTGLLPITAQTRVMGT